MSTTRNRRARRRAQLPDRRIFRIGVLGVVGRKAHVRLIRDRKNGSLHLVLRAHRITPQPRMELASYPRYPVGDQDRKLLRARYTTIGPRATLISVGTRHAG